MKKVMGKLGLAASFSIPLSLPLGRELESKIANASPTAAIQHQFRDQNHLVCQPVPHDQEQLGPSFKNENQGFLLQVHDTASV